MALTTDEPILTSTVQPPATSPEALVRTVAAPRSSAGSELGSPSPPPPVSIFAVLRPEPDQPVDDNLRTVIERGSIAAIDHRLEAQRLAPPAASPRCRSVADTDRPDRTWCPPW